MKLAVVGTGYVGLVAAVCLASKGHNVTCLDKNPDVIKLLNDGKVHIFEPGLEELLQQHKTNLTFAEKVENYDEFDVIVIAVGTPEKEDGTANLLHVEEAFQEIVSKSTQTPHIVIKSTVPPGTASLLRNSVGSQPVEIVSNPEFLREAFAVQDFLNPERVVLGSPNMEALSRAVKVYEAIVPNEKIIQLNSNESAELSKYACNTFLAMKVAFINEISAVSETAGAAIEDIIKVMGSDSRISERYLHPGPGYGGSCFPKDVAALSSLASESLQMPLISNIATSNRNRQQQLTVQLISNSRSDKISILGLAFKANTDDVRDSPSYYIIQALVENGMKVTVYDPRAQETFKQFGLKVDYAPTAEDCIRDAESAVILTEWENFKNLDYSALMPRGAVLFDFRNLLNSDDFKGGSIILRQLGHLYI